MSSEIAASSKTYSAGHAARIDRPGDEVLRSLRSSTTWLAAIYAATTAVLLFSGVTPSIAWGFIPYCLLLVVPLAYVVTVAVTGVETRAALRPRWTPLIGLLFGLALLPLHDLSLQLWQLALALLLATVWGLGVKRRAWVVRLLLSGASIVFLYGAVWNLNHLVGVDGLTRLHDHRALEWDLLVYQAVFGPSVQPQGMFPLVRSPLLFWMLENAYLLLFCEIFVVVFLHTQQRTSLTRFLTVALAAYAIAAGVFYLCPIVGPFIHPETLHADYHQTRTFEVMTMLNGAYGQMRAGLPTNGYGYVVGMPSLHVAMAVILARFLTGSRLLFWTFAPINVLMALATFMLGYHYLIDSLAGLLLAAAVLGVDAAVKGLRREA